MITNDGYGVSNMLEFSRQGGSNESCCQAVLWEV